MQRQGFWQLDIYKALLLTSNSLPLRCRWREVEALRATTGVSAADIAPTPSAS